MRPSGPGSLRRPDRAVRAPGPREPRPGHVTPLPHPRAAARGPGATLGRLSAPTCPAPSAAPGGGGRLQAGTPAGRPYLDPGGLSDRAGSPASRACPDGCNAGAAAGKRVDGAPGSPETPESL